MSTNNDDTNTIENIENIENIEKLKETDSDHVSVPILSTWKSIKSEIITGIATKIATEINSNPLPPPISKIISKDTITRLLRDVKNIIKNPLTDNGIYYVHDDEDMLKGYALIIGPEDTPYSFGNYFFEFNFPTNYPHSPPTVKYCTNGENIRFNPNLYVNEKVCISLLNTWRGEQWTSCQTISTLLLTLCSLLCKDPLLNEPGVTKTHPDFANYTKIIEYKNIDIAILKMVQKTRGIYNNKFDVFYTIIKENFLTNQEKIKKYIDDKTKEQKSIERINTGLYSMINITINYKKLLSEFNETVCLINLISNK